VEKRTAPIRARVALLLAALAGSCGPDPLQESRTPAERPAPETLGLEELIARISPAEPDRPMLVNFWATWCGPCVAELPELDELAAEHADDVRVIAVSFDLALPMTEGIDTPEDVDAFLAERGLTLPLLVFDGSVEELSERLDLPGPIPFTYALDRSGRRVAEQDGRADRARFEEMLMLADG